MVSGIYRCGGVVEYGAIQFVARFGNRRVGVVHHQFLSKGIDKELGASGDSYLERFDALYFHSVAYGVSPKSVASGNNKGLDFAGFDFPDWENFGMRIVNLVQRDKLIKHADIKQ